MRAIVRFFGLVLARILSWITMGVAFVLRQVLAFVALLIRVSWRYVLACTVMTGLIAVICVLLLGHLPTSQFWRGMVVMLIMLGSLAMARGPRIAEARGPQTQ